MALLCHQIGILLPILLPILLLLSHNETFAFSATSIGSSSSSSSIVLRRLPINDSFPGLDKVHSNPDVFVIHNFLPDDCCDDLIEQALRSSRLETSPVAYAGWTSDFAELTELAAKGPVSWLSLILAWVQLKDNTDMGSGGASLQLDLVVHTLQNFVVLLSVALAGIGAFLFSRMQDLKSQRTSTSTTLSDVKSSSQFGTRAFVQRSMELFDSSRNDDDDDESENNNNNIASYFEAPTVIRYESGQVLKPHFDANRSANVEDANRGGQTLATLLVYLNDVQQGGSTRFGRLYSSNSSSDKTSSTMLEIQPKRGDALLFFPADARGTFDERTEHEGCPAVDEKWIARIWRHESRVPPPFGLEEDMIETLGE